MRCGLSSAQAHTSSSRRMAIPWPTHASSSVRCELGGLELETAFVENVATRADRRREGLATAVMRAAQAEILNEADLGVLSTGTPAFYEPLGWERWLGPTSVREADGTTTLTPEEDGFVHVLRTPQDSGRSRPHGSDPTRSS